MNEESAVSELRHFFDHPQNVKRVLRVFYGLAAGLFLIDLVIHRHVIHEWESFTGFYAVFGFIACVVLVLVAKQLRKLVMKNESYFEDE